ncbi:MAG: GSCFA domain-containing protein [Paracoccaceae bacterium]
MKAKTNPYSSLPARAFWRSAVAETGVYGLSNLWSSKWDLPKDARFATYGSCFAQHISRALVKRQLGWLNSEPAPRRTPPELARKYNYGVFSARTGNIYTAAQFLYLLEMASGKKDAEAAEIWPEGAGFVDSLRPGIEPGGFASAQEANLSRQSMLRGFGRSVRDADVMVFTLGLTEGWENRETGQPYAICPGTMAGQHDADIHVFQNYGFNRVMDDMNCAIALLRALNPAIHILLTVSPVPLTATASGQHVLTATTYSKSVLRAVAGELAALDDRIDYFPSYEIITGAATRAGFFEPNLRSVAPQGVDFVMGHFFAGLRLNAPAVHGKEAAGSAAPDEAALEAAMAAEELVCEEMTLEAFNEN